MLESHLNIRLGKKILHLDLAVCFKSASEAKIKVSEVESSEGVGLAYLSERERREVYTGNLNRCL